jgi:phage shock protein PspC (stress-responsive transcriptional regulator)
MSASRTKFYLDKQNAKYKGVCAGIADYTGVDVLWVRVAMVLLTFAGGFPWTLIAYWLVAWMGEAKPYGLYETPDDAIQPEALDRRGPQQVPRYRPPARRHRDALYQPLEQQPRSRDRQPALRRGRG